MPLYAVNADDGKPRLSHVRCTKHQEVPNLNTNAEGAECAICVGDAIADSLGARHEIVVTIYRGLLERCLTRMDILSPGAGVGFRTEIMSDLKQIKQAQEDQQLADTPAPEGTM
jgi:hypothetical protein